MSDVNFTAENVSMYGGIIDKPTNANIWNALSEKYKPIFELVFKEPPGVGSTWKNSYLAGLALEGGLTQVSLMRDSQLVRAFYELLRTLTTIDGGNGNINVITAEQVLDALENNSDPPTVQAVVTLLNNYIITQAELDTLQPGSYLNEDAVIPTLTVIKNLVSAATANFYCIQSNDIRTEIKKNNVTDILPPSVAAIKNIIITESELSSNSALFNEDSFTLSIKAIKSLIDSKEVDLSGYIPYTDLQNDLSGDTDKPASLGTVLAAMSNVAYDDTAIRSLISGKLAKDDIIQKDELYVNNALTNLIDDDNNPLSAAAVKRYVQHYQPQIDLSGYVPYTDIQSDLSGDGDKPPSVNAVLAAIVNSSYDDTAIRALINAKLNSSDIIQEGELYVNNILTELIDDDNCPLSAAAAKAYLAHYQPQIDLSGYVSFNDIQSSLSGDQNKPPSVSAVLTAISNATYDDTAVRNLIALKLAKDDVIQKDELYNGSTLTELIDNDVNPLSAAAVKKYVNNVMPTVPDMNDYVSKTEVQSSLSGTSTLPPSVQAVNDKIIDSGSNSFNINTDQSTINDYTVATNNSKVPQLNLVKALISLAVQNSQIVVDTVLDSSSNNPVANSTVTTALNEKISYIDDYVTTNGVAAKNLTNVTIDSDLRKDFHTVTKVYSNTSDSGVYPIALLNKTPKTTTGGTAEVTTTMIEAVGAKYDTSVGNLMIPFLTQTSGGNYYITTGTQTPTNVLSTGEHGEQEIYIQYEIV